MSKDIIKDLGIEGAKASPPIAVVTASLAKGWTINDTVAVITIAYLLLQMAWLVWRWRKAAKGKDVRAE